MSAIAANAIETDLSPELPDSLSPQMHLRFAALADVSNWRALAPSLHVGDAATTARAATAIDFDAATLASVNARLRDEGYFVLPPVDWQLALSDVAAAVAAVTAVGHLPVFAFMYDETWLVFTRLARLLKSVLGDDYRMLPAFWTWNVDGRREPAGWQPHRDVGYASLYPDRSPKSLTIWIPLTEATPLNGCMYILPADLDPVYGTPRDNTPQIQPQCIRALPSPAGGVLGWTQAVLHWGSRASPRTPTPRISMALEFQRANEKLWYKQTMEPHVIPAPEARLKLILRMILQYQHLYPLAPDLRMLAEAITLPPQAAAPASFGTLTGRS